MKSSLILNNIASAGSIFWRIIVQLIVPPFLIALWGVERYGEWLLITTIPLFLSIADIGFADAAAAEMTMEIAKKNKARAERIFQTMLLLTIIVSVLLCVVFAPVLFVDHWTLGAIALHRDSLAATYLFVIYSALLIFSRLLLGGLKADGYYALSTLMYDAIQFVEGVALVIAAYFGASFVACAALYVVIRVMNVLSLMVLMNQKMSWVKFGFRLVDVEEVRKLGLKAIAAMAIPTSIALNFQGMMWVASGFLGPTAAATLGIVRTASRVIVQLVGIFSRAAMPIYAASMAVGHSESQTLILKINRMLTGFVLVPGCIAFAYFGQPLIGLWTHNGVNPTELFLVLMSIATAFHGMWFFQMNFLLSINRHSHFAAVLVPLTASMLLLALPLALYWGLNGIATSLIILEMLTVATLYLQSNRLTE